MRTTEEIALMELATLDDRWEGENVAPTGSFAHITIDPELDSCVELDDSDADKWLHSQTARSHYVVRENSDGIVFVYKHDSSLDAEMHMHELRVEFYRWDYDGVDSLT